MAKNNCHGCTKLEEHIILAREIKRHKEEVNALKYEMSDEALQQMPDFQGRNKLISDIYHFRLYNTAIRLGELQGHFKVQINPEEYARENLKFGLVEVVYEWAKGTPFADICELTDVPEGMIVRTIVRLDETCREFKNAASIMGNSALYKKMETASNAIKRDIVFAASLYVTGV
ncbi:unnamed protein product [Prunus armeniaca]|uniref:ATP-dependent RNA helicase Ski2/MTR4 C-terminal domain-containing protein n=1 Tax=Prunus armeniaca TaxID=36596 RepID=A0A6J5V0A5_PRUAR|nr:unnamed protein product [Prunus armeniaca]